MYFSAFACIVLISHWSKESQASQSRRMLQSYIAECRYREGEDSGSVCSQNPGTQLENCLLRSQSTESEE